MFKKTMKAAMFVAVMAICGTAMAAPGKKLNLAPKEVTGVVNINTASAKELELLPGVGKHTAGLIVAHREKAPFKAASEIVKVKGVGQGIYKRIKSFLTVAGPTTLNQVGTKPSAKPEQASAKKVN